MKTRIGIVVILFMVFLGASGCSKKDSPETDTTASKTVDLGEVDEDGNVENSIKENDGGVAAKDVKSDKDSAKAKKDSAKSDKSDSKTEKIGNPPETADADGKKPDVPAKDGDVESTKNSGSKKDAKKAKPEDGSANEPEGFNFADGDDLPEVRRPKPRVGLDIERLINIRELREQTGYSGALSEAWLLGQNPDSRYNAMRLSTDNANDLGFAVQVWKPGNESAASKRFGDLYAQSFGGKKVKGLASDAFSSSHHEVHELGFFDKSRRATVLLSCSAKVCTQAQLQSIALTIQRRL